MPRASGLSSARKTGDPPSSGSRGRPSLQSPRSDDSASKAMKKRISFANQASSSDSQSTSRASSSRTRPSKEDDEEKPMTKEERMLNTPTYGGILFTGPTSAKRERKSNSRFSPPPVETRKLSITPKPKPVVKKEPVAKPKLCIVDLLPDLRFIARKMGQSDFSLPDGFGGAAVKLYGKVKRIAKSESSEERGTSSTSVRKSSIDTTSSVISEKPEPEKIVPMTFARKRKMAGKEAAAKDTTADVVEVEPKVESAKEGRGRRRTLEQKETPKEEEPEVEVAEMKGRMRSRKSVDDRAEKATTSREAEKKKEEEQTARSMSRKRGRQKTVELEEKDDEKTNEEEAKEKSPVPKKRNTRRSTRASCSTVKEESVPSSPFHPPPPPPSTVTRRRSTRASDASKASSSAIVEEEAISHVAKEEKVGRMEMEGEEDEEDGRLVIDETPAVSDLVEFQETEIVDDDAVPVEEPPADMEGDAVKEEGTVVMKRGRGRPPKDPLKPRPPPKEKKEAPPTPAVLQRSERRSAVTAKFLEFKSAQSEKQVRKATAKEQREEQEIRRSSPIRADPNSALGILRAKKEKAKKLIFLRSPSPPSKSPLPKESRESKVKEPGPSTSAATVDSPSPVPSSSLPTVPSPTVLPPPLDPPSSSSSSSTPTIPISFTPAVSSSTGYNVYIQDPVTGAIIQMGSTDGKTERIEENKEEDKEKKSEEEDSVENGEEETKKDDNTVEEEEKKEEKEQEPAPLPSLIPSTSPTPLSVPAILPPIEPSPSPLLDTVSKPSTVSLLPPLPSPSTEGTSRTRRSIHAPSRFAGYDLSYGDRKKPIISPVGTTPKADEPPKEDVAEVEKEKVGSRKRKRDEDKVEDTVVEEAKPKEERRRKKKDKDRPRLVLKLKRSLLGSEKRQERLEAAAREQSASTSSAAPTIPVTVPIMKKSVENKIRDRARGKKKRPKQYVPRWKKVPNPHLGFVELENKQVDSVTLTSAAVIDNMLLQICADGITGSTLSQKERSRELAKLTSARRRAQGKFAHASLGPRPRAQPYIPPPREERTKRIRHAPMSKEYDPTARKELNVMEEMGTPHHVVMRDNRSMDRSGRKEGGVDRRDRRDSDRKERKESRPLRPLILDSSTPSSSRHPSLSHSVFSFPSPTPRKASITVVDRVIRPDSAENREKKRRREQKERERAEFDKSRISLHQLLTKKAADPSNTPGKVLVDKDDFFYREIFTDDLDEYEDEEVLNVEGFGQPEEDNYADLKDKLIGEESAEVAAQVVLSMPRPPPLVDDEDEDENGEWTVEDMMNALSNESDKRKALLNKVIAIVRSQLGSEVATSGIKGSQDVLYNTYMKAGYRLKEAMLLFSQERYDLSAWLHRTLVRLLPERFLAVYLETLRFTRAYEMKFVATLNKMLLEPTTEEYEWLYAKKNKEETKEEEKKEEKSEPEGTSEEKKEDTVGEEKDTVEKEKEEEGEGTSYVEMKNVVMEEEKKKETAGNMEVKVADLYPCVAGVTEKRAKELNTDLISLSIKDTVWQDVIPMIVAPVLDCQDAAGNFAIKNKACEYFFRLIRYQCPDPVEVIKPTVVVDENTTIAEAMDSAVDYVEHQVKQRVRQPGKRVILFGWGTSCYICHRVANLTYGIAAIVDLAFPLKTPDGYRGSADDDILLTYCPTLFILGTDSPEYDPYALHALRNNMHQAAGAVVVGNADENLCVSTVRLCRERITQRVVARIILEQIVDFVNMPCNRLERARLVPLSLNNVFSVDPVAIKNYSSAEAHSAGITSSVRRAAFPASNHSFHPSNGPPSTPSPSSAPTSTGGHATMSIERRRLLDDERKRKRKMEEQQTAAGRLASSIASSPGPVKRGRTDELYPTTSYAARIADSRFSAPSPLASPSFGMLQPRFGGVTPAILSHHSSSPSPRLPLSAPSTLPLPPPSALSSTPTPPAKESPKGPLDPASISLI